MPAFIKNDRTVCVLAKANLDEFEVDSVVECRDSNGILVWAYAVPNAEPAGRILATTDNMIYMLFGTAWGGNGPVVLALTQDGAFVWRTDVPAGRRLDDIRIFGNRLVISGSGVVPPVTTVSGIIVSLDRFSGALQYAKAYDPLDASGGTHYTQPKLRSGGGFAYLLILDNVLDKSVIHKIDPANGNSVGSYVASGYQINGFAVDSVGNVYTSGWLSSDTWMFRRLSAPTIGPFELVYEVPGISQYDVLISGGAVYVTEIGSQGGHGATAVRKIRPSDGATLWYHDTPAEYTHLYSLTADQFGRLYFALGYWRGGSYDTRLFALNPLTGNEIGRHSVVSGYGQDFGYGGSIALNSFGEFLAGGTQNDFAELTRIAQPMEAYSDTYTFPGGAVVASGGNGVLKNDRYINPNLSTVEIVTPPSAGILTISNNGEFTYDAYNVPAGNQTFTYRVRRAEGHVVGSASITLKRGLNSFSLGRTQLAGQNATVGTVTVAMTGPPTVVNIWDDSSFVSVPSTVTIGNGQTSKTFPVQVLPVIAQINASVYASNGGFTRSVPLTLVPLVPTAMAFSPGSTVTGGTTVQCRLVLNGVAGAGGRTVSIYDNSVYSDVPNQVTVPAGATETTFSIVTRRPPQLITSRITAAVSAAQVTGNLRIKP